uniref:AP complex mu/sigma subunit domain-containing protein n=1 Tax=Magallana gigas TaxID=29159 RepID=K1QK32_MAGGI
MIEIYLDLVIRLDGRVVRTVDAHCQKRIDSRSREFKAPPWRRCSYNIEGFVNYEDMTLVYKLYVNVWFIVGVSHEENELAMFELFQNLTEVDVSLFQKLKVIGVQIMYYYVRMNRISIDSEDDM